MLGVATNPFTTPADTLMQHVARELAVEDTYRPTPVGVWFGQAGEEVPDPYFGGAGPKRVGCTQCGACMVGCRVGAKNTLDTNYLHLAEQRGAQVFPDTEVVDLEPDGEGGWRVHTRRPGPIASGARSFHAAQVIFSAGSLGTQALLHRLRDEGRLPGISPRLGELTRTNSEAIVGVTVSLLRPGFLPGRRHHLVHPPRCPHAHRAGALSPGQQRHGADRDPHGGRRREGAALVALPGHGAAASAGIPAQPVRVSMERAQHHPPGDADPGQQPARAAQARALRTSAHERAGTRRPESQLDPGRAPCGPRCRREDRRHAHGLLVRGPAQRADHRAHHRRLSHRGGAGSRASSIPISACTAIRGCT